jgi:F-type H+-transporting ATPase subunit epsilon
MNARLTLEILTPETKRSLEDLAAVSAYLTDGSIGILPGHAPLLGETAPQPLLCRGTDGQEQEITAGPGILQVEEGKVVVFAVQADTESRPIPVRLLRNLWPAAGDSGEADEEEG